MRRRHRHRCAAGLPHRTEFILRPIASACSHLLSTTAGTVAALCVLSGGGTIRRLVYFSSRARCLNSPDVLEEMLQAAGSWGLYVLTELPPRSVAVRPASWQSEAG